MKKSFQVKRQLPVKRIVSVLLVLSMIICLLWYGDWSGNNDSTSYAASMLTARRGVLNSLTDLTGAYDSNAALGSATHPYVILEIVPSPEAAEIGYLISGCEPINVDGMFGNPAITSLNGISGVSVELQSGEENAVTFFCDEAEGDRTQYASTATITDLGSGSDSVNGYYEYVGTGNGNITRGVGDTGVVFNLVGAGNGDFVWHTVNNCVYNLYPERWNFVDDPGKTIDTIGQKIYTTRKPSAAEPAIRIQDGYYFYYNRDTFITDTLGVNSSYESIENYSVVVKTITPAELNAEGGEAWLDYADLIYLSNGSKNSTLASLWNSYKKIESDSTSQVTGYWSNDLSWSVIRKIYDRVTATSNAASMIVDQSIYKNAESQAPGSAKKSVSYVIYDWDLNNTGSNNNTTGYNNNVYKLCVMLLSMNTSLFNKMYLSGSNPIVNSSGQNRYQNEAYRDYWSMDMFYLVPDASYASTAKTAYWLSDTAKNGYGFAENIADYTNWTKDKVYVYSGTDTMVTSYGSYSANIKSVIEYTRTYIDTTSSTLHILDVEPSVGLKSQSGTYVTDWKLSENYFKMLVPSFDGTIEVTHMTTAQFNGIIEDLNSTYDLIYFGLDFDAYNTGNVTVSLDGTTVTKELPVWNDGRNGLIYRHTGDTITSTQAWIKYTSGETSRSANFVKGQSTETVRLSGNDITQLMENKLKSFSASGKPIVAEKYLYNRETSVIDAKSFIYDLMGSAAVYSIEDVAGIDAAVLSTVVDLVTFTGTPNIYNGSTSGVAVSNPNYLPYSSTGNAILSFTFNFNSTAASNYAYRLYWDSDKNSRFTDDEEIDSGAVYYGSNSITKYLKRGYVGEVEWKLEIYNKLNSNERYSISGVSAASRSSGTDKQAIKVLQLAPIALVSEDFNAANTWNTKRPDGFTDFSTETAFTQYYDQLADYDIHVTTISIAQFDLIFKKYQSSYGTFSYSLQSGSTKAQLDATVSSHLDGKFRECLQGWGDKVKYNGTFIELSDYDMIIVGCADNYGNLDIWDKYGMTEYLEYWIQSGKAILFTHDTTSINNRQSGIEDYELLTDKYAKADNIYAGDAAPRAGSTLNAMTRDLLGLNAYKMVSKYIDSGKQSEIESYQAANASNYTTLYDASGNATLSGSQGFTYYAAKRLGWYNSQKDSSIVYFANPSATWGSSMNQRMMYKYMIYKPGSSMSVTDAWCQVRNGSGDPLWELAKTGLNNNNDLTTKAECVNQGAITSYPFKISESLTIAETHGQWYQLAMEDEDITVWYTLAYDGDSGKANGGVSYSNDVNCSGSGDHNSSGTSITYGVSPKDCANNYYIYSKGNVFYSGVGHSTVTSSEEAKLFINTMIAAYNTAFALISTPHILIDNSEATRSGSTYNYSIETRQVYDSVVSDRGGNAQSADGSLTGSRTITFYPKDDSGSGLIGAVYYKESDTRYIYFNKNGTLKVYDLNGDYVADAPATAADMKVYDATTGTEVTWTDDLHFKMEIGHKYYIKYYNQYLSGSASIPKYREVGFDISNSDQQSTSTKLSMTIEPLFQLD